jgi:hypothetical protein
MALTGTTLLEHQAHLLQRLLYLAMHLLLRVAALVEFLGIEEQVAVALADYFYILHNL